MLADYAERGKEFMLNTAILYEQNPDMNDTSHPPPTRRRAPSYNEIAPEGTPLHIAVAPGILGHEHVAIRDADDTDEDHASKQQLIDAVLAFARKG